MMISEVEPDLRQIIQNLRDGNVEKAKDRTVELIECAFRMSGPMYREECLTPGPEQDRPTYNRSAGKLRVLAKDLRDVSFHNAARHAGGCSGDGGTCASRFPEA
jgi:hypothetical protein